MERYGVVILTAIIVVSFTCGCLDNGEQDGRTMTMQEFMDDYENDVDNSSHTVTSWLVSLDEGDSITIKDKLQSLAYNVLV